MSKIKITRINDKSLAEIYQSMAIRMALLRRDSKDSFTQLTPKVKCRDFLCDVFSSTLQKTDFGIYGMSWKGSTESPDWSGVYLLCTFPSKDAAEQFEKNYKAILHPIEKANGYCLTELHQTDGDDVLIFGDKKWLKNVLSFSLYTFLLRLMCYKFNVQAHFLKEMAESNSSDGKYVASIAMKTWVKVLENLSLLDTKEWNGLSYSKDGTSAVHHNSGFISVFGKHSEISDNVVKKNAHWKEMKERGLELRLA